LRSKYALILIAAATVSFSASAAPADASAVAPAPISSVDSVNVLASTRNHKLTYSQLESVKGAYLLDDDRKLQVADAIFHLYAKVDNQKIEIVQVAPNVYASRDDALRLEFSNSDLAYDVKTSTSAH
jgi:hypothetical protein